MNQNLIDAGIALCEFLLEAESQFGGVLVVTEVKGEYRNVTLKLSDGTLLSMIYHPAVEELQGKYSGSTFLFTGDNVMSIIHTIKGLMAEDGYNF
jgi:hypothetical protein